MAKWKRAEISDQVRQAIDDSGLSRYQIAQQSGVDEGVLSRFYNGQRSITTDTLDRLAKVLGLRVVVEKKPQ